MATAPTIDFESLLRPISDESPAGVSLKDDPADSSLYYEVKDARKAARDAEVAASRAAYADEEEMQQATPERPDWKKVVELSQRALTEKTKDLWIAAWMLEGLVRLHGFAGLRDGISVIRQMCEKFWYPPDFQPEEGQSSASAVALFPRPDEDGVSTTVAQLAGLNGDGADGALLAPIAAIEITQGQSVGPLTGQDYIDAESLEQTADPDVRSKRIAAGARTLEMFEVAGRETSPEFFQNLREDVSAAVEEFDQLTALLDERCGKDSDGYPASPPTSQIAEALRASLSRVRSIAGEPVDQSEGEMSEAEEGALEPSANADAGFGNISDREKAFQALMKVADFFRRTEPHSPVSYALEQAVRWGRMPLPELIRDLVSDDSARREFSKRTGMPLDSDND